MKKRGLVNADVVKKLFDNVKMLSTKQFNNMWRIIGLERTITRNGQEATARIDYLGNGSRRLTINGGGDNLSMILIKAGGPDNE